MPITYGDNAAWPPLAGAVSDMFAEYGTWYRGDVAELAKLYQADAQGRLHVRPSQRASGLYGWLSRMFWGQPTVGGVDDMERFHIPAAANISALSADLLYSERPAVRVDDASEATDRLQEILEDGGGYAAWAQCAELASAYGSAYLRHSVDVAISDYPIIEALTPHCALPVWRSGRLAEVTFWRVLSHGGNGVLRYLEHHEPGAVQHQLRLGTDAALGKLVPLVAHPETERLAALAGDDGVIATGIPLLDVVHHPNILPNRELPDSAYGRSDYQGAIGAMQALDETWSLWMDALRLARPRLVVPDSYTRGLGPGRGATFDASQRIFLAVKSLDPKQPMQIEQVEFEINVDKYERTSAGNWRTIVRNAGLSADAFGEEASGAQATATEVGQRGARTIATRARKADEATRADQRSATVAAMLDATYYRSKGSTIGARVRIKFADGVTPDPKKDAEIVQLLDAAAAISLRTKIAMAHPDWEDDQIQAEALAIEDEKTAAAPPVPTDPGAFDGDPVEVPPADPAENGRVPAGLIGAS